MAFKGDSIFWVEVDKIVANPFQPRREFDPKKLQELADSVKMYGVLQPLTVTRKEISREDGTFYSEYELIAGERRWRASKLAGLAQVPVIIREGEQSEQEKLELAIIENLQREDLNAVDRALAFRQLADTFELSHAQVAKKVGRSREYVSNTMRLLLLPDCMLDSLKVGDITEGHGRTLLMLNDRPEEQDTVYREILLKKLSVREVERIARKIATDKVRKQKWQNSDPELIEMEKQFTESLGTRVQIAKTDYGGKISIDYFSEEDLSELLNRLRKDREIASAAGVAAVATAVNHATAEQHDEEQEMLEKMTAATPLAAEDMNRPPLQEEAIAESDPEKVTIPEPEPSTEAASEVSVQSSEIPVTPQPQESSTMATSGEAVPKSEGSAAPQPFESQSSAEYKAEQGPTPAPEVPQQVPSEPIIPEDPVPAAQQEQPAQKQYEPFMTMDEMKEYAKEKQEAAEDDSDLYGIKNFSL